MLFSNFFLAWPGAALNYIQSNGIVSGAPGKYEYNGKEQICLHNFRALRKVQNHCSKFLEGDENELKRLVSIGPVVVGVSLTLNMLYYRKGVFSDPACHLEVDHAVVRFNRKFKKICIKI